MKNVTKLPKLPACDVDARWTQRYQPLQDDIQFCVNLIMAIHRHHIGKLLVFLTTRWIRPFPTAKPPAQVKVKVTVKLNLVKKKKKCLRISQKEKGQLESHERAGWTMVKMIRRKWVLVGGEEYLGIETPGN
jgi:hypothetical protein